MAFEIGTDVKTEESVLFDQLAILSSCSYLAWYSHPTTGRLQPERMKMIISNVQTAVNNTKNYYLALAQTRPKRRSIEDRIKEIELIKSLDTMKIDSSTITWSNQPRVGDVIGDAHLAEIGIGNLYVTRHLLSEFERGVKPEVYEKFFSDIVRDYALSRETMSTQKEGEEVTHRKRRGGIRCVRNNSPSGRVMFSYGIELLDSKRRGEPNVIQRIKQGEDPYIIDGKEGIHLELKVTKIFPQKHVFYRMHESSNRRLRGGFSFPMPIYALFIDVIPKGEELMPKTPQGIV
jgi:hypothetical protein